MADDENAKWHWAEGNKYAIEGLKTLLLLNGGSAVALLTFFGNWKGAKLSIGTAVLCFGVGAIFTALTFIFAYLTQLSYGKGEDARAQKIHGWTYLPVALSIGFFVLGLLFTWLSLPL